MAWWLVPLVILAVAGIAFLLLMRLPFGSDGDERPRAAKTETIAEGGPAASRERTATETVVDVPDEPAPVRKPATKPAVPKPAVTKPAVTKPAVTKPAGEISESAAVSTLRGYITSKHYYDTSADCLALSSREYRNAGYTIDVHDSCNSRLLGRWRVDSKTREIFRQREDGRYLRP